MCCIFGYKLKTFVMKNIIIFLSFALMLLVVGCQKEDIRPNTCEEPVSNPSNNEKGIAVDDANNNNNDDGKPVNPITDPNHDEDEDDKIKR
jgi:hypothetical protein